MKQWQKNTLVNHSKIAVDQIEKPKNILANPTHPVIDFHHLCSL
jgi:hypothetical protein